MSERCSNVSPMIRYSAATVETLADQLGQEWSAAPADPFAEDLVLTRPGALQRWLAQRLSSWLGTSGHRDGICAQITFSTLPQFTAAIRSQPSPWSGAALLPVVLDLLDHLPVAAVFDQVRSHLGDPGNRPHRRIDFARLTANRFAAYATWNTAMLKHWQAGDLVGPDGSALPASQLWQPQLWQLLCEQVGTPWEDSDLVYTQAGLAPYSRIALFCPDVISPTDEALLQALDQIHPLWVFSQLRLPLASHEVRHWSDKLSARLEATTAAMDRLGPPTVLPDLPDLSGPAGVPGLLGRVQRALTDGEPARGAADDSVQIHAVRSDRQISFLSDLLVSLLADDPTLEPRQILVLVHQMGVHQPLLEALLRPDDSPNAHPRHRIRTSIDPALPPPGSAVDLLLFLAQLVHGRATAEDLLRLCSQPAVMAHFGFTDTDRISTLITSSGIRWGLNPAHRTEAGMEGFAQNTWMAGLGRMVLGVALNETDLAWRGTVLPLDVIDSDAVHVVESLSLIIAHIRSCCVTWRVDATAEQWAQRFRDSLTTLTGTGWLATPVQQTITAFAESVPHALTLTEAESILADTWRDQLWHPWFLNGDLAVAPLGSMSLVPYRVVILAGLDAASFPQSPPADGDDLTAGQQPAGQDPRIRDRQIVHDALLSARDKFIAIYNGSDPVTAADLPIPTPLTDLAELSAWCCDSPVDLVTRHSSFRVEPASSGFTSSAPASQSDSSAPVSQSGGPGLAVPVGTIAEIAVDDLCEFYASPAAFWVRRNAGLPPSVLKDDEPIPTEMTIALSGLDIWQIVGRMMQLLLAGKPADAILQAELRRGLLPPGPAGTAAARDCLSRAQTIVQAAKSVPAERSWLDIAVGGGQMPDLVGQVEVFGDQVIDLLAGRIQPRHQIAAWIKLVSLAATHPGRPWKAHLVSSREGVILTAPPADEARRYVDDLRRFYLTGLASPLPLPSAAGAHLARCLAHHLPVDEAGVTRRLATEWERDLAWGLVWPSWSDLRAVPIPDDEISIDKRFSTWFEVLAHRIYEPMMRAGGVS